MLLNNPLDNILGQASKVKILRFLINSQAQLNGREIAKSVGLSHVKVHTALKELSRHGLVNMRSVGKSFVYWLNEEHFLVKDILRPIFEKEAKIFQLVTKVILKETEAPLPLSMILFGSFVKNTALPDSDIDVILVYPNRKNKSLLTKELTEAEKKITLLFGNHLSCVPMRTEEFQRRFKKQDKFIKEVLKTAKVIYGKSIAELINVKED